MTQGEDRRRGRARSKEHFKRKDVEMAPDKERLCPIANLINITSCVQNETCWFWIPEKKRCRLSTLVYNLVGFLARRGKRATKKNDGK
ncbi:MAG: hypothetical protein GF375_04935 [Candidatus Omnitrophica bacterium]|nr:hypothetical protein [Candidatus Omnitrophota bacterium]